VRGLSGEELAGRCRARCRSPFRCCITALAGSQQLAAGDALRPAQQRARSRSSAHSPRPAPRTCDESTGARRAPRRAIRTASCPWSSAPSRACRAESPGAHRAVSCRQSASSSCSPPTRGGRPIRGSSSSSRDQTFTAEGAPARWRGRLLGGGLRGAEGPRTAASSRRDAVHQGNGGGRCEGTADVNGAWAMRSGDGAVVRNHCSARVDCTRGAASGRCRRHKGPCRCMCGTLLHSQRMLTLSRAPVRHLHDSGASASIRPNPRKPRTATPQNHVSQPVLPAARSVCPQAAAISYAHCISRHRPRSELIAASTRHLGPVVMPRFTLRCSSSPAPCSEPPSSSTVSIFSLALPNTAFLMELSPRHPDHTIESCSDLVDD
jgi:hypothetical protein